MTPMLSAIPISRPTISVPRREWLRTWAFAASVGTLLLFLVFGGYEVVERTLLRGRVGLDTLFALHIARGMSTSMLVGTGAVLTVWRLRRHYDEVLRGAIDDLTKRMEERTRELEQARAFTERVIRHKEKMAAIGMMAAGVAHDLANPLASMSSELEMLEGETDPRQVRDSAVVIRSHIDRMARTLRELTEMARRRSDVATSVSLSVVVTDAIRMVRHDPRARRVNLHVDVPPDLPLVTLVEDHLVMTLVNLLINAYDAMPEGGDLTVCGRPDATGIVLSVTDTGAGMSEEVLSRAMEPLFTTKGSGRGTGLGLSVSAEVMRNAGGSLSLESREGEGTKVTLHFPEAARSVEREVVHA